MQQPERVPAGWYPDPLGMHQVRWWDSYSWTENTQASQDSFRTSETIVVSSHLGWADPEDAHTDEPKLADVSAQLARIPPPKFVPPPAPSPPPAASPVTSPAFSPPVSAFANAASNPIPSSEPRAAVDNPEATWTASPNRSPMENAASPGPESTYVETPNGWLAVNFAINTAWKNSIIRVISKEMPEVTIDCERGLYWCEVELDALPRKVRELTVRMQTKQQTSAPTHAGRDLQGLLWMLGVEIDFGTPMTNVNPSNRFKLRRLPTMTSIRQSDLQVQMTTMLGNAFLTPAELAAVTKSNRFDATRLIAAYQIMGLIVELPDVASPMLDSDSLGAAPESFARRLWATLKK